MNIGDTAYFKGREITITTEPYELYGGMWVDGIDESGKLITIATKTQRAANAKIAAQAWTTQQAQFRNLKTAPPVGQ